MELRGARVLLTGASTGIGAELAVALGEQGATLGLVARRAELLDEVLSVAKSRGAHPDSRCWAVDLADTIAAEQTIDDAWDHFGGLDAFVSNAAMIKRRNVSRLPAAELDHIMRVNFLAPAHMTLALLPRMHEQGSGMVVMVGSMAGRVSAAGEAAYVASKHALAGFTETLAIDLADSPIIVRLITPGPFDTKIWDAVDDEPTGYDGPRFPPSVAAESIANVLAGGGSFETIVPPEMSDIISGKNADVDGWIAMSQTLPTP